MRFVTHLLSIAVLAAARIASAATPAPLPSALPELPVSHPCHDGVISKDCSLSRLIDARGMPLRGMYAMRQYQGIDQMLQVLCTGSTRLPDGQPELQVFESSFEGLAATREEEDSVGKHLREWRSAWPDSPAQALVETMYWRDYAWRARGNGYASSVPPEAWELFGERMSKATARLAESKPVAGNCPLWHSLKIKLLNESGAPREQLNAAYEEAVKAFPSSQMIYFAMSRAMQVKWGAEPGEFDRFARRAIELSKREEGNAIYARLYWVVDCNCESTITFGKPGDPDWKLMKSGFEEMLRRYPDQVHNLNKFASYACRANDRATYAKLRRELGDNIIDYLWPGAWKAEVCDRRMSKE